MAQRICLSFSESQAEKGVIHDFLKGGLNLYVLKNALVT
jgi:hypothetical protein